jgi:hypothetical protein
MDKVEDEDLWRNQADNSMFCEKWEITPHLNGKFMLDARNIPEESAIQ